MSEKLKASQINPAAINLAVENWKKENENFLQQDFKEKEDLMYLTFEETIQILLRNKEIFIIFITII